MTILYSCRHAGDQYRISKFDEHMEVLSSYLCTTNECDCPAGVRPMCRHREMLPLFIRRNAVGSGWMLDFDRGGWVQMHDDPEPQGSQELENALNIIMAPDFMEPKAPPIKSWRRY